MARLNLKQIQQVFPKQKISAPVYTEFAPSQRVQEKPQAPMARAQQAQMPQAATPFSRRLFSQYQAPVAQAPIPTLEKLRQMILDPNVQSIECPGPDQFILVNRYGVIQAASIKLSKDEINDMLKEISQRVRIPVITGMYKVRYQNLLITAVISEFVGTRFVIQKAPPLYEMPTRF